jgi:ABC-2 type transport system ATP-binding protein
VLDGLVERRDGANLVIRSADPAALNARLVAANVPVRALAEQRRGLEEIVLAVTGSGADQFGVPPPAQAPVGTEAAAAQSPVGTEAGTEEVP